jgi:putative hemolysin
LWLILLVKIFFGQLHYGDRNGFTTMFFIALATPEAIAGIFHFLITVVGVTFILVLFGEAMPKIYATLSKHKIVHLMSGPLTFLMWLFNPISRILVGWSSKMEKRLSANSSQNLTSKEDIDAAIDLTMTNDTPHATQEADILKGIVNFGDTSAKQIMHPAWILCMLMLKIPSKKS